MLDVRNIAFAYGRKSVLRDVSFSVSPGEVVGVVGLSGAGKTTLLKILATLSMPDSGSVLFDSSDIFSRSLRYRRQVGYLAETPPLYDDMTVKEFLEYRSKLKGESPKRVRRRVSEAMEVCKILSYARYSIKGLSAGLRRRVALADALMLRPRILLLDDFLSGLDLTFRERSSSILSEAAAFSAAIVTGHEIADLAGCVTRFLVLKDGVVASSIPVKGLSVQETCALVKKAMEGGLK